MQVRKFEAKSMKDALEMVKSQLGPEAIILSARDNKKAFGLLGESSVEVTAAVSNSTLQNRLVAQSKISESKKKEFEKISARAQKEFINKVVTKYMDDPKIPNGNSIRSARSARYVDILDESLNRSRSDQDNDREDQDSDRENQDDSREFNHANVASKRIQNAAKKAYEVFEQNKIDEESEKSLNSKSQLEISCVDQDMGYVNDLQKEILELRTMLKEMRSSVSHSVAPHPGAEYGLPYELSQLFVKLVKLGITEEIVSDLLKNAKDNLSRQHLLNGGVVEAWVAKSILDQTQIVKDGLKEKIHFFLGPRGQGKTSALIKLASHLVVEEDKSVVILSADSEKVGSVEQMRIYTQILNVPFGILKAGTNWTDFLKKIEQFDYVLVDMPGMDLKSFDEINFLARLLPENRSNTRLHFVQSLCVRYDEVKETVNRFKVINFDDVIFTNIDVARSHGMMYSFQKEFDCPIHSFSIGSKVPEDFEFATAERLLDLLFNLTRRSTIKTDD